MLQLVVNDESFYNVIGEEIKKSDIVQIMINQYINNLEVGQTQVTDFNEGSEIRGLLEAFAVGLYSWFVNDNDNVKCGFVSTAEGEYLDMLGDHPLLHLPRDEGSEATGTVVFSIPEAVDSDIIIPADTVLAGKDNGLSYTTNDECSIIAGETECTCFITCVTVGDDGNCLANTITIISDITVDNRVTVTNPEALTDGTNYEDDEAYRERLLETMRADNFGSLPYYTDLLENITGVHDVYFADDPSGVYTKQVYINGSDKPVPDSVLLDCLVELSEISNKIATHNFIVAPPIYETVNLNITLDVTVEYDTEELYNALKLAFDGGGSNSVDYTGLYLGETLTSILLKESLLVFDGIKKVRIKLAGTSADFEELGCDPNTVFELGTVNFTQNVIGG